MRDNDYSSQNIPVSIHFPIKYIISLLCPLMKIEDSDYFHVSSQRYFKIFFESLLKSTTKMDHSVENIE